MNSSLLELLLLLLLSCFSRVWLCNPIDGSPLGSSLPGILQARILEWRHHLILIQHLILITILWEKYYHLNFAKTKGKLEEIIYFPKGTLQVGKTGFQFRGWQFFFSIKGQKINIFGCVGHMVSVAVINLCGFITEAAIGLPWWLSGKEFACQCRRQGFDPWFKKIPQAVEQLSLYTTTIESEL